MLPPRVSSPGLFDMRPSSGTSGVRTLADIPPSKVVEFERRVLYTYGRAQVGFDVCLETSFQHLTVCSRVDLVRATTAHAEGKGEVSLSLPFVATGSIPRIYRRASFTHRATPTMLPLRNGETRSGFHHGGLVTIVRAFCTSRPSLRQVTPPCP